MHVQCDNDTSDQSLAEKRGMYVCRICKYGPAPGRSHNPSGGSANSCSPIQNSSGGTKDDWDDNSLDDNKDLVRGTSLEGRGNLQGMGRGKPMSAMSQGGAAGFPGKRRRLGMVGRPPGSFGGSGGSAFSGLSPNSGCKPGALGEKPHGQPVTTAAAAIASKKRGENRKKGLSQSVGARGRGMVALQVLLLNILLGHSLQ